MAVRTDGSERSVYGDGAITAQGTISSPGSLGTAVLQTAVENFTDGSIALNRQPIPILHRETGPAAFYEDGTVGYFWKGVRVSEWIIMEPEKLTAKKIFKEENLEVRRSMIDIYGQGKLMKDLGATMVHEDKLGKLWEIYGNRFESRFVPSTTTEAVHLRTQAGRMELSQLVPLTAEQRAGREILGGMRRRCWVEVKDGSSERTYFLAVPGTMKTASQAIAWTFKMKPEEYQPTVEA